MGYACRLLRKAYLRKAHVFVWVAREDLARVDAALWTMSAGEFVPHCRSDDVDLVKARSPIEIGDQLPELRRHVILVNLRHDMPDEPAAFQRVIEVVTLDEADRVTARERWRQYKALGMEPQRHDLQLAPTA